MRIGIASSQRLPPDPCHWIRYHVDMGVEAFYIIFEDSPGYADALKAYVAGLARDTGKNLTLYTEERSVDRASEDNYTDIMGRQDAWVNKCLKRARSEGVDWLFHIDDDEILYAGKPTAISTWPEVLETVAPSCAAIHMQNWEAYSPEQPTGPWLSDAGVRFMPASTCGHLFAAYGNGKSGSRTLESQRSYGPHMFKGGKTCELSPDKGIVAHFEALAMGPEDVPPVRWVEKNKLRIKDDLSKVPFVATKDAVAAVKSGDEQQMMETWRKYRSVTGSRFKACPNPIGLALPSHHYGPAPAFP